MAPAPRRAAIQAKRVVNSSDAENEDEDVNAGSAGVMSSWLKSPSKAKSAQPSSKKRPPKAQSNANANKSTIHSFFGGESSPAKLRNATQNPAESKKQEIDNGNLVNKNEGLEELFEDISDEEIGSTATKVGVQTAKTSLNQRKRSWDLLNNSENSSATSARPGHKFLRTDPAIQPTASKLNVVERPWIDEYPPTSLTQLSVHPRKVADVRKWFEAVLAGQIKQRLLVLKGPAGSGKSATLSLVAKVLDCELLEWRSPSVFSGFGEKGYASLANQFEEFMSRAGRYTGLELVESYDTLGETDEATTSKNYTEGSTSLSLDPSKKQAIVVEEFPSLTGSSTVTLSRFRNTLLEFISRDLSSQTGRSNYIAPLVLVISESRLAGTSLQDSLTAHRLLSREVLHHPCVAVIEFNSVAPTYLTKALKLVIAKHAEQTGVRLDISTDIIQKLAEIGDIRNAIACLEFACLNLGLIAPSLPSKSKKKGARGSKSKSQQANNTSVRSSDTTSNDDAVSAISTRESTLTLFHALGKVLYNKRMPAGAYSDVQEAVISSKPPPEVAISLLQTDTGTDTSTFLSALHENYLSSTFVPGSATSDNFDAEATLKTVEMCLEALSDADLLSSSRHLFDRSNTADFMSATSVSGASEGFRQQDIAFYTGVEGIRDALPIPVKRRPLSLPGNRPTGSSKVLGAVKVDAFRMFFPTALKLRLKSEEIKSIVDDLWLQSVSGSMDGAIVGAMEDMQTRTRADSRSGSVVNLAVRIPLKESSTLKSNATGYEKESSRQRTGNPAHEPRLNLLLDRLPYLLSILKIGRGLKAQAPFKNGFGSSNFNCLPQPFSTELARSLHEVIVFQGVNVGRDDDEDMDAVDDRQDSVIPFNNRAQAPKGSRELSNSQQGLDSSRIGPYMHSYAGFSFNVSMRSDGVEEDVEKLILSDDDIEDEGDY